MPENIAFTPSLLDSHCIIVVRTPLEYAEDHLPGAVNWPVLDDTQRAEIGTEYKQASPFQARKLALGIGIPAGYPDYVLHSMVGDAVKRFGPRDAPLYWAIVVFLIYFGTDRQYEDIAHHEVASFRKEDGVWYFVDGIEVKPRPFKRLTPKLGPNDPCSCGSGKKYKKCCGA